MLTFTNTPVTKLQLVRVLKAHQRADRIVQGHYWIDAIIGEGSGCAVGCTLHDFGDDPSDHSAYERLFGIPEVLAYLEDGIFEGLPEDDARKWPLRFANAIPEGKDLSLVWPKFAVWMLLDPEIGALQFVKTDAGKEGARTIADGFAQVATGRRKRVPKTRRWDPELVGYTADYTSYAGMRLGARWASTAAASAAQAYGYANGDTYGIRRAQANKLIELLVSA